LREDPDERENLIEGGEEELVDMHPPFRRMGEELMPELKDRLDLLPLAAGDRELRETSPHVLVNFVRVLPKKGEVIVPFSRMLVRIQGDDSECEDVRDPFLVDEVLVNPRERFRKRRAFDEHRIRYLGENVFEETGLGETPEELERVSRREIFFELF